MVGGRWHRPSPTNTHSPPHPPTPPSLTLRTSPTHAPPSPHGSPCGGAHGSPDIPPNAATCAAAARMDGDSESIARRPPALPLLAAARSSRPRLTWRSTLPPLGLAQASVSVAARGSVAMAGYSANVGSSPGPHASPLLGLDRLCRVRGRRGPKRCLHRSQPSNMWRQPEHPVHAHRPPRLWYPTGSHSHLSQPSVKPVAVTADGGTLEGRQRCCV